MEWILANSFLPSSQVPLGQLPILLMAGQVLLEAGKESIPGLLGGFLKPVDRVELLNISVAGHPGSAHLVSEIG